MILQTERAQEGSINDRCPAQSVIFAEAADASPGAAARIAIHGAVNVPVMPVSHGAIRIPMHVAEYFQSLVESV